MDTRRTTMSRSTTERRWSLKGNTLESRSYIFYFQLYSFFMNSYIADLFIFLSQTCPRCMVWYGMVWCGAVQCVALPRDVTRREFSSNLNACCSHLFFAFFPLEMLVNKIKRIDQSEDETNVLIPV